MNERGWFWVCYFGAVLGVCTYLLGCAQALRPLTPVETERLGCRVMAERICGTHAASGHCRGLAYRECAALSIRTAKRCRAGTL